MSFQILMKHITGDGLIIFASICDVIVGDTLIQACAFSIPRQAQPRPVQVDEVDSPLMAPIKLVRSNDVYT